MPRLKTRGHNSIGNKQINRPKSINADTMEAKDGNGVQKLDGRANLAAGTTNSMVPKTLNGPAVVSRTYGS